MNRLARGLAGIGLLGAVALSAGCQMPRGTAKMIEARQPSIDGPINEERGGHVRYEGDVDIWGQRYVHEARRDAYRKMKDFCGGPYELVREWDEPMGSSTFAVGYEPVEGVAVASAHSQSGRKLRNLQFRCVPAPEGPPRRGDARGGTPRSRPGVR